MSSMNPQTQEAHKPPGKPPSSEAAEIRSALLSLLDLVATAVAEKLRQSETTEPGDRKHGKRHGSRSTDSSRQ